MENPKSQWTRESGYIFSMIGSAVGFANIVSFSAQCYKNGGGAFLIPFLIAMLIVGLPMLILEGAIGQHFTQPLVTAYHHATGKKWTKIFAWLSVLSCATIGMFYLVLTGWSIAYTYFAATGQIPRDTATFFTKDFLQQSSSILEFGHLSVPVAVTTLCAMAFTWWVLVRDIQKGIERACSIFLPLLALIMLGLSIYVAFLPGASIGFYNYLYPDFEKLQNFALWRDAFGHVFFSLSMGLGIAVGYSRYTKSTTNIARAMRYVVLGDLAVSMLAGLAVFGCIGYMSHLEQIPFSEIVKSVSTFEIAWVIFPRIIHDFSPLTGQIVGSLFFFSLFIAGVTGQFSIVECVAGNVESEFKFSRKKAVTLTCLFMTGGALFFCMGNATHIIDALAPLTLGKLLIFCGIAQVVFFVHLSKPMKRHSLWQTSRGLMSPLSSLRFLIVPILVVVLAGAVEHEISSGFGISEAVRYSWLALILLFSIFLTCKAKT